MQKMGLVGEFGRGDRHKAKVATRHGQYDKVGYFNSKERKIFIFLLLLL